MPSRCVLIGLYTIPVPDELAKLNTLETQLIQHAKCVVRLGTYTGKVPIYNALKAAKGTFLPLDIQNTFDKLDEAGYMSDSTINDMLGLPDPELYIMIDSRPTKDKIMRQSLIDVPRVKLAAQKLQETNWLYGSIDLTCVDDAAKKTVDAAKVMDTVDAAKNTIGIIDDATSRVIEKASDEDVAGLQCNPWISLYLQVKTFSITSCSWFMNSQWTIASTFYMYCVFQPCSQMAISVNFIHVLKKLSFSEYVKSRLLNKDSKFRKNAKFVFYYLWQKELQKLSAGIYNVLSSCGKKDLSVKQFMDNQMFLLKQVF